MKYILALLSFVIAFSFYYTNGPIWLTTFLAVFGALCLLAKSKKKRKRSKALYSTLDELADAIEAGEATLDPTIRAILTDIYDQVDSLADNVTDDNALLDASMLTNDLERALYPNGMTEKQAEAACNRKIKKAKAKRPRQS